MTMPINPLLWADRRSLLPKKLTYAFSMDLNLALEVPFRQNLLAPVCWPPLEADGGPREFLNCSARESNIYRIGVEDQFVTAGGQRPDVPAAYLIHADDQIVLSNRITGSLAGRLLFKTDTPSLLRMDYTGVVNFKGWPRDVDEKKDFSRVSGTAFVSARQEIGAPRYRWLVYNQLVGVGRIGPTLKKKEQVQWAQHHDAATGKGLLLTFAFDFYVGT